MQVESDRTRTLMNRLDEAGKRSELARLGRQIPTIQASLVRQGLSPDRISREVSLLSERLTVRMLELAEHSLGSPPVTYAFVVAGSLARREQIAGADQDNAIILDDTVRKQSTGEYFSALSGQVCSGLDSAGFALCSGQVMATNPRWCCSLETWRKYFDGWIETPEPNALLHAGIFFDLRCIHGRADLLESLRKGILEKTRKRPLFQSHLAASALQYRPALTLLRRIRLERHRGRRIVDLKAGGVTPVVDIARVRALAAGLEQVSTRRRLAALEASGHFNAADRQALETAFDCISRIRMEHQAEQIEAGQVPDYRVPRSRLDRRDYRELRHALATVARMQSAMTRAFQARDFT